jgi:hypothetical protein
MHAEKLEQQVKTIELRDNARRDNIRPCLQGEAIKRITCVDYDTFGKPIYVNDRQSMVQAARGLLSAVTRVLLLADMVVVKQIICVKKKVRRVHFLFAR